MLAIVGHISAFAGIIGVSLTNWLSDPEKAWAALGFFVLLMIYGAHRVYLVSKHFLSQHYPDGYLPLSTTAKYTTSDGKNIVYELLRHIQIKRPVMTCFDHRFAWSGTKDPVIKSDLQIPSEVKTMDGETRKHVRMAFRQSRTYNDVEIVHILMEIDDSDGASQPFIGQRVESPVRLITFDVELLHVTSKYFGEVARLSRRLLDKPTAVEEYITTVKFNPMTKSFSYQLPNPEPGFQYLISWNKPPLPAANRRKGDKAAQKAA